MNNAIKKEKMKYKLIKQILDLGPGAVFTLNEKANMYKFKDWGFTKESVEGNPEWFSKVD